MFFLRKYKCFLLFFLIIFSLNSLNSFYLLAYGNQTGEMIKFEVIKIKNNDDKVDVYITSDSYIGKETQLSIKMAKEVICSIFWEYCKNYDFLIKIYSENPELIGPSGGSAFATAILKEIFNLSDKNIAITGTINPGGVIGPVGGLVEKVKAGRKADLVLIPLGQKIYRDPSTNKTYNLEEINPNIKEVGTIFDIAEIIWGLKFDFGNKSIIVPEWYKKTMKEIAQSLCSKVSISLNEKNYYSQASKCFVELINKNEKELGKKDLNELEMEKQRLIKEINTYERKFEKLFKDINSLNKLQLYMILYERLNDAKEVLNDDYENKEDFVKKIAYAKARIETINEWLKFLNNMPPGIKIDKNFLRELCKKNYEQSLLFYNYLIGLNVFLQPFVNKEWEKLNKNYLKNDVLCIMYSKILKYKVDSLLTFLYLGEEEKSYFFKSLQDIAKFYLLRNKEFPIIAYSYYNYAKYLVEEEKDYNSGIIYLQQSINFATMIYELDSEKKEINFSKKEEIRKFFNFNFSKEIIIILAVFIVFIFYFMVLKENKII